METNKLKWCFKIKDGLRIIEPNERLAKSYLEQSKASLLRAKKNFADNDLFWTTITIYYAEYYAIYSFLQSIGIKCENHACSILAVNFLLGNEIIKTINEHKTKRIDAQYYMKIGKEKEIENMIVEAQQFIVYFDELTSNTSEKEIVKYREKLQQELKN